MPRYAQTIGPADSASQVSMNRGSLLGRQPAPGPSIHQQQSAYKTSVQAAGPQPSQTVRGSALGRQQDRQSAHIQFTGNQGGYQTGSCEKERPRGQNTDHASTRQRYSYGQGVPNMAPIKEESARGRPISENNVAEFNNQFQIMKFNTDINVGINHPQGTSHSSVRRPEAASQVAQPAAPAFPAGPMDQNAQHFT